MHKDFKREISFFYRQLLHFELEFCIFRSLAFFLRFCHFQLSFHEKIFFKVKVKFVLRKNCFLEFNDSIDLIFYKIELFLNSVFEFNFSIDGNFFFEVELGPAFMRFTNSLGLYF